MQQYRNRNPIVCFARSLPGRLRSHNPNYDRHGREALRSDNRLLRSLASGPAPGANAIYPGR